MDNAYTFSILRGVIMHVPGSRLAPSSRRIHLLAFDPSIPGRPIAPVWPVVPVSPVAPVWPVDPVAPVVPVAPTGLDAKIIAQLEDTVLIGDPSTFTISISNTQPNPPPHTILNCP